MPERKPSSRPYYLPVDSDSTAHPRGLRLVSPEVTSREISGHEVDLCGGCPCRANLRFHSDRSDSSIQENRHELVPEPLTHLRIAGRYPSGEFASATDRRGRIHQLASHLALHSTRGSRSQETPSIGLKVSVVIPVFNSEDTIRPLVSRLVAALEERFDLQIVLVDDSSRDGSAAACRAVQNEYPQVVDFVMLSRNFGEHNAVMAGLNRADGDYCVIMDDDLQNPPEQVARLIDEARLGYDVVYVQYDIKQHSPWRNLGSHFHNWMATRALGKPKDLYLSSFKVLSRFVVEEAILYTGPDPYLDAIVLQITRNIGVVPVTHQPRQQGTSNYTLGKLFSLWGNMIVSFSSYPLRLLGIYGLLMTGVGLSFGLYILAGYLFDSIPDPNAMDRLTASLWFFRGIHLLFISIVGEYVGRIYKQMKREPQFIVRHFMPRL